MLSVRRPWTPDALAASALTFALVVFTATSYSLLSVALVCASIALAAASYWSCAVLCGLHAARVFLAIAAPLGWFAEQMGSTHGWFFGDYHYTEVLGPRLGSVPLVIPFMWFGLCHMGWVIASLVLWRDPVRAAAGWKAAALTALMAAMLVTAFDLGADPYFVYVLKAWIMTKTDGGWFGETIRGFEGWMLVSFVIVSLFQLTAQPQVASSPMAWTRRAALLPVLVYAGFIVFQVTQTQPAALRVVAFFAMGIPALIAATAWFDWKQRALEHAQ